MSLREPIRHYIYKFVINIYFIKSARSLIYIKNDFGGNANIENASIYIQRLLDFKNILDKLFSTNNRGIKLNFQNTHIKDMYV